MFISLLIYSFFLPNPHYRFFFLSTTNIINNQIIKENTFSQQEKSLELAHSELYLIATFHFDINVLKFVMHTNTEKVLVSIPTNLLAKRNCWFGFATHKVSLFSCFSFNDVGFVVFGYNLQSTVHI